MPRKPKPATAQSEAVEEAIRSQPAPAPAETAELPEGVETAAPGGINEKIRQLIRLSKEQGLSLIHI